HPGPDPGSQALHQVLRRQGGGIGGVPRPPMGGLGHVLRGDLSGGLRGRLGGQGGRGGTGGAELDAVLGGAVFEGAHPLVGAPSAHLHALGRHQLAEHRGADAEHLRQPSLGEPVDAHQRPQPIVQGLPVQLTLQTLVLGDSLLVAQRTGPSPSVVQAVVWHEPARGGDTAAAESSPPRAAAITRASAAIMHTAEITSRARAIPLLRRPGRAASVSWTPAGCGAAGWGRVGSSTTRSVLTWCALAAVERAVIRACRLGDSPCGPACSAGPSSGTSGAPWPGDPASSGSI